MQNNCITHSPRKSGENLFTQKNNLKIILMKKLLYLLAIIGLGLTSCNKPEEIPLEQDVVLEVTTAATNFKSSCDNPVAHYAQITMDGTTFNVDVFYLDGKIYTNTIKLTPTSHSITMFVLKNDNGTPGNLADDVEVLATPTTGAAYASFVNTALPQTFQVDAFKKNEVKMQVLCFKPTQITNFGFSWFAIDQLTVREIAFFGDFCTKYYADYVGSLYALQSGGLRHDMPAIFKIDVKRNGNLIATYNNEAWKGEGQTLKVQYPDYHNVVDNFEFDLSILVKVGTTFQYKKFHTWTTTDAGVLPNIGSDNVMDFVLGSCVPTADLILPPYMNLPISATLLTGNAVPGTLGTYFNVTLSGIGAGFDLTNGVYGVYCGDMVTTISLNTTYSMNIFSSLYPATLPGAFDAQKPAFDNVNWLGNNLYRYPAYTWKDLQNAVWMLVGQLSPTQNGVLGVPSALAIQMKNDANLYGNGYLPPVGGYAAVMFVSPSATATNPVLQLIFTLVDP